jgi:aspartyl-tRNA(Asn)/glutamyl-tRNA(Gln) amidotransferase subunit B
MENKNLYKGQSGLWEVVIGMEIHAQAVSKSKLFSGAATEFGADPNTQVSFVDGGFPGVLPVLNAECVNQAIRTGLGMNCEINKFSAFDRKNYFYPDLPNGYQISQFYHPIVGRGKVILELEDGSIKEVGIHHIHLEQDAGKSFHDLDPDKTYIDLNRAGVCLMEIVTDPDMRGTEEAQAFIKKLRTILRYLGTCDGNMEQGNLRADVNISVRKPGEELRNRVEVKNVNSIRFIGQAIEYEVQRQIEVYESGGEVTQETRLFDPNKGETRSMRSKEEAKDYRYFPDPDLLPVIVTQEQIDELKKCLPELPDAKKARLINTYKLTTYDATVLVGEKENADYYETAIDHLKMTEDAPKILANWMTVELFSLLNKFNLSISQSKISAEQLAELVNLITADVISGKIAKTIFAEMWESGKTASSIVDEKGLRQVVDESAISNIIQSVLDANPDHVSEYRSGKDKLFGFFVGQVMKAMEGRGNPGMINNILKKLLEQKK